VHVAVVGDGALCRDQGLGDGLPAEDALPVGIRTATSIEVVLQALEVENGEKLLHSGSHYQSPFFAA
jgi:hypothetical protein